MALSSTSPVRNHPCPPSPPCHASSHAGIWKVGTAGFYMIQMKPKFILYTSEESSAGIRLDCQHFWREPVLFRPDAEQGYKPTICKCFVPGTLARREDLSCPASDHIWYVAWGLVHSEFLEEIVCSMAHNIQYTQGVNIPTLLPVRTLFASHIYT